MSGVRGVDGGTAGGAGASGAGAAASDVAAAGAAGAAASGAGAGGRGTRRRAAGFPAIGATVPAALLTAVTLVAGAAASCFVIGVSGWLVIALLLVIGSAAVPRGPFAALLSVVLAVALVIDGFDGYTGRFVILLVVVHLLLVVGSLSAWLPRRARVQTALLRPPLLRFLAVQVVAQAASFVILTLVAPSGGPGSAPGYVWLGIVGAAAALTLALVILVPALLRPSR